jgi:predicted Zn-dependent protease
MSRPVRYALLLALGAGAMVGLVAGFRWLQGQSLREEALLAATQRPFPEAEPLLVRALDRYPNDAALVRPLALGHLASDRPDAAEPYLTRWCDLAPRATEPLLHRIALWQRLRRLPLAVADARRVVELDPGHTLLRGQLARWLLITGEFEEAERQARLALEQRPGDPNLLFLIAETCYERGDHARAGPLVDALVQSQPRFGAALYLRAVLHREAGQPHQAIPLLRQVIELDPLRRQAARYHLSLALAQAGQTDEAQKVEAERRCQEALDLWAERGHMPNAGLQVRVAEGLLGVGKHDEAVRLLEKTLQQDASCTAAHRLLAEHYQKQGQADRAAEHRRKAGL